MNKIELACKCGYEETVKGKEADWLRDILRKSCSRCGGHDIRWSAPNAKENWR